MKPQIDKGTVLFTAFALIVLLVGGLLAKHFWTELQGTGGNADNLSTTIRNVMLMIGAFLALPLAIWRGWVAERQVKATSDSVNAAHQAIANQRFQAAAQMLGDDLHAVRLGAVQTLSSLAREAPDRYYINAATLLAEFVRHPPRKDTMTIAHVAGGRGYTVREDVNAAMRFIGTRKDNETQFEIEQGYRVDLTHARLQGYNLQKLNLTRVLMSHADLERSDLSCAIFSESDLTGCFLSGVEFGGANLRDAHLSGANLTAWHLSEDGRYHSRRDEYEAQEVTGLTQRQLDQAHNDQDNPPKLRDVKDAESGKQLLWHGRQPT